MDRPWKFSMTPQHGPMWDLYEGGELVAYARRAKDGGWFVRIKGLNPSIEDNRIYIDEETSPVSFMNVMLELHPKEKS